MKAFFDSENKLEGLIADVETAVAALKAHVYGDPKSAPAKVETVVTPSFTATMVTPAPDA
jgi:hypothetical protein